MTQFICCRFKSNISFFIRIILLSILTIAPSYTNANNTDNLSVTLADVISPLLPSVVTIQTIKHTDTSSSSIWQKIFFSERITKFAKNYKLPFTTQDKDNEDSNINSIGSGFIIDETGFIVTNYHVIEVADEIFVKFANGAEYPAHLIGSDPKTDLALLKIEANYPLPYVLFGDSDELRVGDTVIAIGNPFGLGGSVTTGIISFKGRDLSTNKDNLVDNFLQTDATINIGNSGGPLFNIHGEVIGLNSSIPKIGHGLNVGIGFAVPSNTVKTIILELKDKGQINRGKIGITVQMITNELAEALESKPKEGLVIVGVQENGPGDKAGLRKGDIITKFNQHKVISPRKLELLVAECEIGDEIEIEITREDKVITSKIKIIGQQGHILTTQDEQSLNIEGITFSNINEKNVKKFGLTSKVKAVFIEKIDDAIQTELQVHDIILSIDKKVIEDIQQLKDVHDNLKKGNKNKTVLLVKRDELEIFVPYNF
ncbi:MAG: trypsin-like peptidase domain-containing protein [Rickettsiaceae bacterium]|nr:trypsin-like peptidase domain-containing protein [Rickettsiaceae bacterium]